MGKKRFKYYTELFGKLTKISYIIYMCRRTTIKTNYERNRNS